MMQLAHGHTVSKRVDLSQVDQHLNTGRQIRKVGILAKCTNNKDLVIFVTFPKTFSDQVQKRNQTANLPGEE